MKLDEVVLALQRHYPRVFHACHVEHVRRRTTRHRLSAHDSALLSHLDPGYALAPSHLARHLGIGKPALSAALKRLESHGYVTRERSAADKRRLELRLTEQGERALSGTSVLDAGRLGRVLSRLAPAERARVVAGFELLSRACREFREGRTRRNRS